MPILELASVDDLLGPRQGRFLGEGFKQVEHALSDLTVSPGNAGVGGIEATAGIAVVGLWSRKGERPQKPHLSTVDAMLFAARLTGLYAAHTFGLAPGSAFAVESVDLKAGAGPDEDELEKFPVSGRLVAANREGDTWSTTLECRIGSMAATVRARHGAGRAPVRTPGVYRLADELPGAWNDAPFGVPHTARGQLLTGVRALVDGSAEDFQASARVALTADDGPAIGDTAPTASPATMIDALVAVMNLGQVLLYTLDGVDRARTNNLWMRRARITAGPVPSRPGDEVTARLDRPLLLPSSAGTWRSADVVGFLHGVEARVGVAHLLPTSRRSGSSPLERWRS